MAPTTGGVIMTREKQGTRSLKVKSGIKAGKFATNHSARGLKVKAGIKAGKIATNRNARLMSVG
jgi:hypothetical protein